MAKADILSLVDDFLLKPDESGEAEVFCDEIIRELGFREFLTGTESISVQPNVPAHKMAVETIRLLEAHLGQVGRLDPVGGTSLRAAYGGEWRYRTGTPYHYTRVDTSSDVVRLFPIPVDVDVLTLIRTEAPEDVPYWMELAIALEVFSRMLARESAQKDLEMAQTAKQLSSLIWLLLGLAPGRVSQARSQVSEEG